MSITVYATIDNEFVFHHRFSAIVVRKIVLLRYVLLLASVANSYQPYLIVFCKYINLRGFGLGKAHLGTKKIE